MPDRILESADDGTPSDLLPPQMGKAVKDRTSVESIYLLDAEGNDNLTELDSPIDLTERSGLYEKPAEGVIVTTQQEWIPNGVSLGRLLHSLPLAPGESTRIAIVDWSRQVAAQAAQTTVQTEQATEDAARHRGVSEITEAIAREEQHGASVATSAASSSSRSASGGISFFGGGAGVSSSRSNSRGVATNVSRSSGRRDLSTNTSQKIEERAEQLATSSRDRRATVVQETSEVEGAQASTRVVTNYNHMHALTIEYWEVIQQYKLRTSTKKCERCLFVPMKVVTFDDTVFKRYAGVLADAAPEPWAERLAAVDPFETTVYRTRSSSGARSEWMLTGRQPQAVPMGQNPPKLIHFYPVRCQVTRPDPNLPKLDITEFAFFGVTREGAVGWDPERGDWIPLGFCQVSPTSGKEKGLTFNVATGDQGARLQWILPPLIKATRDVPMTTTAVHTDEQAITYRVGDGGVPVMSRELDWTALGDLTPGGGAEKLTVGWDESGIAVLTIAMRGDAPNCVIGQPSTGETRQMEFDSDERLTKIVLASTLTKWGRKLCEITIATDKQDMQFGARPADGSDNVVEEHVKVRDAVLCGLFGSVDPDSNRIVSLGFQLRGPHVLPEVLDHLNDNELYYSQVIWANADELALTRILANHTFEGAPLAARLDPTPIATTGNYLGFRWHFPTEEDRKEWMKAKGLQEHTGDIEDEDCNIEGGFVRSTTVSLPTDGVFAEAVLGRANGAEKLDITRFWDWQSSPIQILPPGIAPVDTGSRAGDVQPKTGEFAPPTAVIHAMSSLPEPTGAAASLQAIATGNLFRDMSGLEATGALLQKGLELAANNDWKSAEQSTKAMDQANKHMEKMSQIAVDAAKEVAPMLLGPGGAAANALANPSKLGALLNFASDATRAAPHVAGDESSDDPTGRTYRRSIGAADVGDQQP